MKGWPLTAGSGAPGFWVAPPASSRGKWGPLLQSSLGFRILHLFPSESQGHPKADYAASHPYLGSFRTTRACLPPPGPSLTHSGRKFFFRLGDNDSHLTPLSLPPLFPSLPPSPRPPSVPLPPLLYFLFRITTISRKAQKEKQHHVLKVAHTTSKLPSFSCFSAVKGVIFVGQMKSGA